MNGLSKRILLQKEGGLVGARPRESDRFTPKWCPKPLELKRAVDVSRKGLQGLFDWFLLNLRTFITLKIYHRQTKQTGKAQRNWTEPFVLLLFVKSCSNHRDNELIIQIFINHRTKYHI
jgi:hypothetical protein